MTAYLLNFKRIANAEEGCDMYKLQRDISVQDDEPNWYEIIDFSFDYPQSEIPLHWQYDKFIPEDWHLEGSRLLPEDYPWTDFLSITDINGNGIKELTFDDEYPQVPDPTAFSGVLGPEWENVLLSKQTFICPKNVALYIKAFFTAGDIPNPDWQFYWSFLWIRFGIKDLVTGEFHMFWATGLQPEQWGWREISCMAIRQDLIKEAVGHPCCVEIHYLDGCKGLSGAYIHASIEQLIVYGADESPNDGFKSPWLWAAIAGGTIVLVGGMVLLTRKPESSRLIR